MLINSFYKYFSVPRIISYTKDFTVITTDNDLGVISPLNDDLIVMLLQLTTDR